MVSIPVIGTRGIVTPGHGAPSRLGPIGGTAPVPPLDGRTDVSLAKSISRLLLSSYAGNPLIRVRRVADNAEQDIGHLADGSLDTSSLLSFAGAGDAALTTVYEQSGIAGTTDFTQTTTALQPLIVEGGSLVTLGSRPAMRSPTVGADKEHLTMTGWTNRPGSGAILLQALYQDAARGPIFISGSGTNQYSGVSIDADTSTVLAAGSGAVGYYKNGTLQVTNDGVATRDDLHAAFGTGESIVCRHDPIDFTGSGWANFRTAATFAGSIDPLNYQAEWIVLDGTSGITDLEAGLISYFTGGAAPVPPGPTPVEEEGVLNMLRPSPITISGSTAETLPGIRIEAADLSALVGDYLMCEGVLLIEYFSGSQSGIEFTWEGDFAGEELVSTLWDDGTGGLNGSSPVVATLGMTNLRTLTGFNAATFPNQALWFRATADVLGAGVPWGPKVCGTDSGGSIRVLAGSWMRYQAADN